MCGAMHTELSSLRPAYHVTPPQGRLNDPNGMYVDGDTLHVYYQHDPGFPSHQSAPAGLTPPRR